MDDAKNIAEKHVFGNSGFGKYTETEVAETLRSSGGDIGGGSENLALHGIKQVHYVRQITSGFSNNRWSKER
jgi:hypothetical protein